jgi:exosortase/archaeosortase family protein
MARFLVRFIPLLIGLGLVLLLVPDIQEPAQVGFARILVALLRALGWSPVQRTDVIVDFPGGGFIVGAECTGLSLLALLIAFVVAFPAPWRARLTGLAWAAAILFVANLVRLVTCAFVMRYRPDWFTFTHEYVWQIGLVGLTFALITVWARGVAPEVRVRERR